MKIISNKIRVKSMCYSRPFLFLFLLSHYTVLKKYRPYTKSYTRLDDSSRVCVIEIQMLTQTKGSVEEYT